LKNPLSELLNRILKKPSLRCEDFVIYYIDRGTEEGFSTINCSLLVKVTRDYFHFRSPEGILKAVPLHRIIKVVDIKRNIVVYEKGIKRPLRL